MTVITQQIDEPKTEVMLAETIQVFEAASDDTSRRVQRQYEENPYPRWVKISAINASLPKYEMLRRIFPLSTLYQPSNKHAKILIAGCGTGQQVISSALDDQYSSILAVDLSMRSLCYAKRKSIEYGLDSIEFVQADILQLQGLSRKFDVIESVGVLHHMHDLWAAWAHLLNLLESRGIMKIGLYSTIARRPIMQLKEHLSFSPIRKNKDDIRRIRQVLLKAFKNNDVENVFKSPDFNSTSGFRDLLLHESEKTVDLLEIKDFIKEKGLNFLGFELPETIKNRYRQYIPSDKACVNLDFWSKFENEFPDTFSGMYQFWVQLDR